MELLSNSKPVEGALDGRVREMWQPSKVVEEALHLHGRQARLSRYHRKMPVGQASAHVFWPAATAILLEALRLVQNNVEKDSEEKNRLHRGKSETRQEVCSREANVV